MIVAEPVKTRLRKQLLERGRVLATLLSDVLSGKSSAARLSTMGVVGKPGMRPEEKLRWTLDRVEARRRLLEGDDDRFGRCETCACDLGEAAVDQMPWADRCLAHAGN